jgi:SAM-dependent methyltransferase
MTDYNFQRMPKPSNYGEWWKTNSKNLEWYEELYNSRRIVHRAFAEWVMERESSNITIDSVLEIGCGRAVSYADLFKNKQFVGYDISEKEIDWCKQNRKNPLHNYIFGDFLDAKIMKEYDLVFSHAVIDHIYDINLLIVSMVEAAKKLVYITSYRGWFPDLKTHAYRWSETDTCFYNNISPHEIRQVLVDVHCKKFVIAPLVTANPVIPYETVIIIEV